MLLSLLLAAFPHPIQAVPLAFGQREAVVIFEADSEITSARSLCECTKVSTQGKKLTARVDVSGFAQSAEKQIEATTADGKTTRLTMDIRVPQAIVLSARSLIWKAGSAPETKELRVSVPKNSPVKTLTGADLSGSDFDYTPQTLKSGAEYRVKITPKSTQKTVLNRLIIRTDSPDPRYAGFIVYLSVQS